MSNYLTSKVKEYRYKSRNNVALYVPSADEFDKLKEIINQTFTENGAESKIEPKHIKFIYDNLTSLSNETIKMTLNDFANCINNKVFIERDREMIRLYREIEKLIKEVIEDIEYDTEDKLYKLNHTIDALIINKEQDKVMKKIEKFAKDNGQEVNINELIEKDKEINKLEKQIELEKENIEKE